MVRTHESGALKLRRFAGHRFEIAGEAQRERGWEFTPVLDLATGRPAVLKQPLPAAGDAARDSLLREFRLGRRIRHPSLVRPLAFGTSREGKPFIAWPANHGQRLDRLAGEGPLPADRLALVLTQLLGLAAFLHSRGLVMRDFDPRAFTLAGDQLLLVDPGITDTLGKASDGAVGGSLHSLHCLPPEIAHGGCVDGRSDQYAIGCLAVWLATGAPPFPGRDGHELIKAHIGEPWLGDGCLPRDLPAGFGAVVGRLLAKDPRDRYPDALAALEAVASAFGTPVEPTLAIAPPGHLHAPRIIGRDAELLALDRAVEDVKAGRGRAIFLAAPPGLGKSLLVDEACSAAEIAGFECRVGRSSRGPATAYAPVIEALGELGPGLSNRAALSAGPEDLSAGKLPQEPRVKKLRAFQAVCGHLREHSRNGPLAVLVEDVHWCDAASAELLEYLVRDLADCSVLFVVSFRPEELPAHSGLRLLLDDRIPEVLTPAPLAGKEVEELACELLGSPSLPPEVLDLLGRQAGGNPFFAAEILRALLERGTLRFEDRRWVLDRLEPELSVPETIQGTILARVAHLPDALQDLTRAAAVAGDPIDAEVLAAILHRDVGDIATGLAALTEHQILARVRDGLRFEHAHTREAISVAIPAAVRSELHTALAEHLRSAARSSAATLAHHFLNSRNPERAIPYLEEAALDAIACDSTREAIGYLMSALEQLARLPVPDEGAMVAIRERVGRLAWLVEPSLAIAMIEAVLDRMPRDDASRPELTGILGSAYAFVARLQDANRLAEEAIQAAEGSESPVLAGLLVTRGIVRLNAGQLDDAEADFREARRIFAKAESLTSREAWAAAYASNNANMCRALRGEPPEPHLAGEALRLIETYQFPDIAYWYEYVQCTYLALTGRYREFMEQHARALAINRKMGYPLHNETLRRLAVDPAGPRRGAESLSASQRSHLGRIETGALQLSRLVDDLLDCARLEAGKFQLSHERVDLGELLAEAVSNMAPLLAEKRLDIELEVEPPLGPLEGDAARLTQILNNLLSNAVKYTPEPGHIRVTARRDGEQALVEVADTGPGIPEDARELLFSKFQRIRRADQAEVKGTGLGLSISKGLVEAHGGQIGVRSREGSGSVFWFTLPLGRRGDVRQPVSDS